MANKNTQDTSATFDGVWDATPLTVVICSALAGFNSIECLLLIFSTFKKYQGLYFWSLVVATTGIIPYMPGVVCWYFDLTPKWAAIILIGVGWYPMVTGQSVILYSRLGLVLGQEQEKLRRMVKWMIIINGIVFHVSITVISPCSIYAPNPEPFARAYYYMEKLQMTAFSTQELIISSIYIWKTLQILRTGVHAHPQRIIIELFTINLIIVLMDVGLLALEYRNLFFHELAFKMVSYSVKAKLEFAILSKLVELSSSSISAPSTEANHDLLPQDGDLPSEKTSHLHIVASGSIIAIDSKAPNSDIIEEIGPSARRRYSIAGTASGYERSNADRKMSEINYASIMKALSK